jgi:nucleoside-diphosphate-sugar epimerase
MTVTVLGGAGFVGARLAAALREGGLDPWLPGKGDPEVLTRDLGVVFYCAGLTADYDARPFDAVEAHASLLNELIRQGRFERLVYCSSTRLYDGLVTGDEAAVLAFDPANPRGAYDLSKALGENLTITRTAGRGSVARLANVYDCAEGSPGFLSDWLIAARSRREITLASSPDAARDYIHLDDAVAALIAVAEAEGPVFNVASGERVTNAEIAGVFGAAGWRVSLTGRAAGPPPPPVSVERLAALGVRPRRVRDVVRGYLEGLKA